MKNFIFDIDGTLIDTIKMYIPALQDVLAKHGYDRSYDSLVGAFGITAGDALIGVGVKSEEIESIITEWFSVAYQKSDQVKIFPQIEETLHKLSQLSDVQLMVATSKTADEYNNEFKDRFSSISKYFDVVVTADDTDKHKPDPDPILKALEKSGANAAESMYIGDTVHDMQAAQAANVKFGSALWGSATPDKIANADFSLKNPLELIKIAK